MLASCEAPGSRTQGELELTGQLRPHARRWSRTEPQLRQTSSDFLGSAGYLHQAHRPLAKREELWGHCGTCYYGEICKAGCSFTSHSTLGRRGNNPFCYYRADKLRKQGIREVLRLAEKAPGAPYDFGRFELFEEPWDTPTPEPTPRRSLPII